MYCSVIDCNIQQHAVVQYTYRQYSIYSILYTTGLVISTFGLISSTFADIRFELTPNKTPQTLKTGQPASFPLSRAAATYLLLL